MSITNQKIIDMINSYYTPLNDALASFRAECEEDHISLILRETENYLNTFLKILDPKRILEIGTAYGYSAAFFATLLPSAEITTIEHSDRIYKKAQENIIGSEWEDRIHLHAGEANEILDELCHTVDRDENGFDFVFIDAAKSHYREFFDRAEMLCKPGAVIVCDNILMRGYLVGATVDPGRRHRTSVKRMNEFLQYINNERDDLTVSLLSCGDGLAIIKLND